MRSVTCLLLLSALSLSAQTFGTITGEVVDISGAKIPDTTLTVRNTDTNVVRQATTNAEGIYSIPALMPGPYEVKAVKAGFRPVTRSSIELQVQQTARVDFAMDIGQVSEAIEVSAMAALLNTDNATIGTVVEGKGITDLPLNGRNFFSLVAMSPGVQVNFGQELT